MTATTPTRTVRVLIAEDSAEMRAALAELITTDATMQLVGEAQDVEETAAAAETGLPDVALVDVRMPGGGGPAATRAILERCPQARVIALSAYSDPQSVLAMLRAGAMGYLVKGTATERIPEAIHHAARGEAVLSREVTAHVLSELVHQLNTAERLSDELRSLDRTKSELVQILSHELLTPVAVIQATVATLLRGGLDAETSTQISEGMTRASDRMSRLVRNITTAAALRGPGHPITTRPVPVEEFLTGSGTSFASDGDRIDLPKPTPGLTVWAHTGLAARAIAEVIDNALRLSEATVEVTTARTAHDVEIRVADRGPGIPPETVDRMLEPFTQQDSTETRSHPGVGIGLYLASRIMDAHQGRIDIRSRPGGGTIVTLAFPAVVDFQEAITS